MVGIAVIFAALAVLLPFYWVVIRPALVRHIRLEVASIIEEAKDATEYPNGDAEALRIIGRRAVAMISVTDSIGFLEVSRVHVSDADKERFRNERQAINQSCSSVRALSVRLNEAMLASILANSPGTLVPLTVLFAPIVVLLVLAALFFTRVKTAWSDVGEGLGARTFSVVDSN